MAKEKVNYQEVYDLYQLCSETKDLREFCADYGVNYDKFMNWQRHQLWSEKLGKTVQAEQPKVAKVQITGKPCNSPTVKLEVKHPEGECKHTIFRLDAHYSQPYLCAVTFNNNDYGKRKSKLSGGI